jgi:hypothetical protein
MLLLHPATGRRHPCRRVLFGPARGVYSCVHNRLKAPPHSKLSLYGCFLWGWTPTVGGCVTALSAVLGPDRYRPRRPQRPDGRRHTHAPRPPVYLPVRGAAGLPSHGR